MLTGALFVILLAVSTKSQELQMSSNNLPLKIHSSYPSKEIEIQSLRKSGNAAILELEISKDRNLTDETKNPVEHQNTKTLSFNGKSFPVDPLKSDNFNDRNIELYRESILDKEISHRHIKYPGTTKEKHTEIREFGNEHGTEAPKERIFQRFLGTEFLQRSPMIDPEFEHLPETTDSQNPSLDKDWHYDFPTLGDYEDGTQSKRAIKENTEHEIPIDAGKKNFNISENSSDYNMPHAIPDHHEEISDFYFDSYDQDKSVGSDRMATESPDSINSHSSRSMLDSNENNENSLPAANETVGNLDQSRNETPSSVTVANVKEDSTVTVHEYEDYDYSVGHDLIHAALKKSFLDSLDIKYRSFVFNPVARPHEKFQECTTPQNETGHCRYVQHCFLPSIIASLASFMSHVCIIEERFIGICCPEFPVHTLEVKWKFPVSELQVNDQENITQPEVGCGISSKTRIIGGNKADPNEWPWMAALLTKSQGRFFCGGSLINSKYVLTAAHCTFSVPRNQILVRLGEYDFSDSNDGPGEDYPVVEIKRHAQYSRKTLRNDIALLKLARSATFGKFVGTICLPEKNAPYTGKIATLAGWGNIRGGGPTSEVLLEASFPVWSNMECTRVQGILIHRTFICAGDRSGDKGACNGDSGGPLMLLNESTKQWKAIGVVSWGRRGCSTRFPTVFTRVSSYLNWIETHSSD